MCVYIKITKAHIKQVLDIIEPPYTEEFGKAFLPILQNNSITAPIKSIKSEDESDPVSDFIREFHLLLFSWIFAFMNN